MVFHECATIQHFFPLGESRADAWVGVLDLTGSQVVVNFITVGAQVQVVEYACGSPKVLGADGERCYAGSLQLVTVAQQLVPGFGSDRLSLS